MRKSLLFFLLMISFSSSWNLSSVFQSQTPSDKEPESGSVVCPPEIYGNSPSDCLPLGPSGFLSQSAAEGIPYPYIPLPAYSPDRTLSYSPYRYFKVIEKGGLLYDSQDAIRAHQPSQILYPSNHLYVSYIGDAVKIENDYYYPLRSGRWVLADGARLAPYDPPFQGLVFSSTPKNSFGWVLGDTPSRISPSETSQETGVTYSRFQVVQIYTSKNVGNLTWDLVAPGEWLDARQVSRVDPNPIPPTGVTANRWISVNLFEQTVAVYDHNQLIFATMASTGVDHFWTRPGLFQIRTKLESTPMSNSVKDDFYYLEDVPWTMYFDESRALHGAYWHKKFGYPQSHGCVNLSVGDAHWLYNWASVGDYVYVYDPSGRTPTDPALFGNGAP